MTTNFALSLSADGIDLLHRVPRGWRLIGSADVDDPDLGTALKEMREKALAIDPTGLRSKVVIPLDQIKYLAIDSTRTDLNDIHAALDGTTPYALDELVIDFKRSGGRTHIAAVARETLQEAEGFARAHGFNPVCFVAVPEPFTFQSEVFFGPTTMMPELLGAGATIDRDPLPVLVVGTRIKSRLLVFDTEAADDDDFDLTALLAGGLKRPVPPIDATEQTAAADVPAHDPAPDSAKPAQPSDVTVAPALPRIDRIVAEYHAPAPAALATVTSPDPVTVDPILAEDHAPAAVAPAPAIAAPVAHFPAAGIDPIIAEFHPALAPKAPSRAAPPITTAAPPAKTSVKAERRPTPVTASDRRPFFYAAAVAAAVVLVAGLVWSQRATSPVAPPPQTMTQAAPITAPVSAETAAATSPDIAPALPVQDFAAPALPDISGVALTSPGLFAAPVTPVPPALQNTSIADAPLTEIESPPEAPAPDVAAATPGAPILRGRVLTPDEATQAYAATGVWQRAPRFVSLPRTTTAEGIVRPALGAVPDRLVQPAPLVTDGNATDQSFLSPAVPPAADVTFAIDDNGFILATPEGTLTPEGAVVFAGLPDLQVRARPELTQDDLDRMAILAPAPEGIVIIPGPPAVQPPLRPADIAPAAVSAGGVALSSLENNSADIDRQATDAVQPALRPRLRPRDITPPQQPVDLPSNPDITSVIAGIDDEPAAPFIDMTPRAVGASTRPEARPRNFARVVASARSREQAAPTPPPAASAPKEDEAPLELTLPQSTAPVPGGVARAATQDDVIPLRDINLIGVYGRPNDRRALVRLGNGRYVRVEVGSTLDGGQVTAIGENALNYVKRGRTYALELPKG